MLTTQTEITNAVSVGEVTVQKTPIIVECCSAESQAAGSAGELAVKG